MLQTQMSFLFLTGDYVYKVKKPVDLGYLDYTTLEKRHFYCQQELILNKRLCPTVYLAVVPIAGKEGVILIEGEGKIIEYAVKMRQLSEERMMDKLLPKGQVSPEMIREVAQKLADFHRKAETSPEISTYGDLPTIITNTEENFAQTQKYICVSLSSEQYQAIETYTHDFIERNTPLFHKRVKEGKIRDCHGDLHAAHICFADDIHIYDCIEFNDRFRYCDIASEIAFLAMDLDRYRRADLSQHFITAYVEESADEELLELLNFYKCYRAYVRGKVESFKLDDPYISEEEKKEVLSIARHYFELAHSYIGRSPILIAFAGLMGTGKTTIAQALGERLEIPVISSDAIRKRLANIPATQHRFEEFKSGIYSEEFSRRTYEEMLAEAKRVLSKRKSAIVDASFKKAVERQKARLLAEEMGASFLTIECVLDEETTKQRLEQRLNEGSISDGRWEIYQKQESEFENITEIPTHQHMVINTSQTPDKIVGSILAKIGER